MTSPLIEHYLPIDEISIESIRERAAASALPPINWLHVWWARRPLTTSRAAVAASLMPENSSRADILAALGIPETLLDEHAAILDAKEKGVRSTNGYSRKRAFTQNPTAEQQTMFRRNGHTPTILDVTAGGGSIPFEAGRLGLNTIANELNPVAAFILRATCEWPQRYGYALREHYGRELGIGQYDGIIGRYLERVRELLEGVYPDVGQPAWMAEWNEKYKTEINNGQVARAKRYDQTYLFARAVSCPSCNGRIPLSPNWRLDPKGNGLRIIPNTKTRTCEFKIVTTAAEQSPGTISRAIATCPYPDCGATSPKGYIAQEAQAGRLGQQLYAIIYRDQWHEFTKTGRPKKRLTTKRGFRAVTPRDDNTAAVLQMLADNTEAWERNNVLPTEERYAGDADRLINYGMTHAINLFSPRQQLAHGLCVQAFHELINEDYANNTLNDLRRAAWGYIAIGLDKLINRNNLLSTWVPTTQAVAQTFDTHDFGMKWSHTEMAVAMEGLGLEWALNDMGNCIDELIHMAGHTPVSDGEMKLGHLDLTTTAPPTQVITGPAQFIVEIDDASIDCIVFDPPYHNNVRYAELSDFFYVWLKRTAGYIFPDYFTEHLADKTNEAIALPCSFPRAGSPSENHRREV